MSSTEAPDGSTETKIARDRDGQYIVLRTSDPLFAVAMYRASENGLGRFRPLDRNDDRRRAQLKIRPPSEDK